MPARQMLPTAAPMMVEKTAVVAIFALTYLGAALGHVPSLIELDEFLIARGRHFLSES